MQRTRRLALLLIAAATLGPAEAKDRHAPRGTRRHFGGHWVVEDETGRCGTRGGAGHRDQHGNCVGQPRSRQPRR
jgi:hypothetical protein